MSHMLMADSCSVQYSCSVFLCSLRSEFGCGGAFFVTLCPSFTEKQTNKQTQKKKKNKKKNKKKKKTKKKQSNIINYRVSLNEVSHAVGCKDVIVYRKEYLWLAQLCD